MEFATIKLRLAPLMMAETQVIVDGGEAVRVLEYRLEPRPDSDVSDLSLQLSARQYEIVDVLGRDRQWRIGWQPTPRDLAHLTIEHDGRRPAATRITRSGGSLLSVSALVLSYSGARGELDLFVTVPPVCFTWRGAGS